MSDKRETTSSKTADYILRYDEEGIARLEVLKMQAEWFQVQVEAVKIERERSDRNEKHITEINTRNAEAFERIAKALERQ